MRELPLDSSHCLKGLACNADDGTACFCAWCFFTTSALWAVAGSLKGPFGILQASTVSAVERNRTSWGHEDRDSLHDSMSADPCRQDLYSF